MGPSLYGVCSTPFTVFAYNIISNPISFWVVTARSNARGASSIVVGRRAAVLQLSPGRAGSLLSFREKKCAKKDEEEEEEDGKRTHAAQ